MADRPGGGAADGAEERLTGHLAELVARLRAAGWEPSAEEVAEAVWLARWTLRSARDSPGDEAAAAERRPPGRPSHDQPPTPGPGPGPHAARPPAEAPAAPVSLYAPGRHHGAAGAGFPVRAPAAGALSGLRELQLALRPLHGYRPPLPPLPGPLDEEATADLSARSGAVRPVFGTTDRRATEIQLLMDASPTTAVWQPTLDRLRQTFEQLGAFRDVQVRYLHRARDGSPLIGTGPGPGPARLRPADQYRDTTGRRLTLVLSDCVGPLWQEGRAQSLLHHWTGGSPLAVVQPLPPRLWPRTALPAEPGTLVGDRGAGGRVAFEPDGYGPGAAPDALPVPVLLPTPRALGNWARLLGGSGRLSVPGAAAWVRPRHPAMPPPAAAPGTVPPRTLLAEFRSMASPGALDLAVHLAVVPLLMPVMHLVQEAMLPDTGPMEMAEVLLSGLLERMPDREGGAGPRYRYLPGVRELLLQSLDQGAAALVLKHLSGYVSHRFGKGTRNFPAVAVARLTGRAEPHAESPAGDAGPGPGNGVQGADDDSETAADELFAEIPAEVVRFYLPSGTAPERTEEAERLLEQWHVQGDAHLLDRARTVAESALASADTARARLVLARVLRATAGTARTRRSPDRVAALLDQALTLLGRAPDGPGGSGDPGSEGSEGHGDPAWTGDGGAEARLELAAVRYDLWRTGGGTGHLAAAEEILRALAAPGPHGGPLPDEAETARGLRHGRVLLALAEAGPEPERGAAEAADVLRTVTGRLSARPDTAADGRLCGALLDLAAALRLTRAAPEERLAAVERAYAAAGDSRALRLSCVRERARVHRDGGDWRRADEAYAEAERLTARDSARRGELLAEWGAMLLREAGETTRAEGILREALTSTPYGDGDLTQRLHLLIGQALVRRFRDERARTGHEGFLPDLYEGCHLLEQAARGGRTAQARAEAWLALGDARLDFPAVRGPNPGVYFDQAQTAYAESLRESERAGEGPSLTVARAWHGRGVLYALMGRERAARADFRAARDEWRRLAATGVSPPGEEVRATDARLTGP
ncbi:SAV_2336 N-terminal domain-related protein [Streptomyces albiaxialis]|uniref:SAV_2336 N-terminal domain-related protein n=1 Tax=Streptomyces albiaxialis TaxID=329523 RepID=A0ABN2VTJ6_9ACTN